jgi:glycosyltransferase involved in cell wall biosynthesis
MVIKLLVFFSHFVPKKIICCSESVVTTHVSLGYPDEKMITITNGVDSDRFHPDGSARKSLREELGLPLTEKLVGMFARYHPQKDHANFIHAAGLLSEKYTDVHFILSGENVDETNPDLCSLIINAGIQDRVHLLGKRQDMPRLHAAMDINSLSSSFGEALPMAWGEGMSCGVPCVATRVGDIESLIDNTGKVVEPGNPNALAEAWFSILELRQAEYNELSNKARQRVLLYYGLSGTVNLYQQIYKQVMIIK